MTGEKDRYSSLEKLGRFEDESLATPKHDEMVVNLLSVKNASEKVPIIKEYMNAGIVIAVQKKNVYSNVMTRELYAKVNYYGLQAVVVHPN